MTTFDTLKRQQNLVLKLTGQLADVQQKASTLLARLEQDEDTNLFWGSTLNAMGDLEQAIAPDKTA